MDRPDSEIRENSAGNSLTPAELMHEERVLPRDVYALLAQANLLRMRGHWEDAAQSCMAALRLAPDSSSANSLLGDIYENQGRYDDAAQWYRMALDANPDSPADRLKLDRLYQRDEAQQEQNRPLRAAQSRPVNPALSPVAAATPAQGRRRMLPDPEIALRYGAIAAALGLILVVACAYVVVRHAGTLNGFGRGHDAVVNSAPVIVPPLAGALPADPDGVPAHDQSEQALLTTLQASRDLSALGIAVYDVQADPRINHTTITFGFPEAPGQTQAEVTRDALQVLQVAASAAQSPETYTARCLLVSDADKSVATLAFVGDISREALLSAAAAGSGLTDVAAVAAFTNVWWSSAADIRA